MALGVECRKTQIFTKVKVFIQCNVVTKYVILLTIVTSALKYILHDSFGSSLEFFGVMVKIKFGTLDSVLGPCMFIIPCNTNQEKQNMFIFIWRQ